MKILEYRIIEAGDANSLQWQVQTLLQSTALPEDEEWTVLGPPSSVTQYWPITTQEQTEWGYRTIVTGATTNCTYIQGMVRVKKVYI